MRFFALPNAARQLKSHCRGRIGDQIGSHVIIESDQDSPDPILPGSKPRSQFTMVHGIVFLICCLIAHCRLLIGFRTLALHVLHGQLADELFEIIWRFAWVISQCFSSPHGIALISEQPWSMLLERLTPSAYP
ncbi:MAG TPA: hypothetical protein VKB35_21085 [Ktedonobacteraceae bacterium]|nr:hypothetical protein [Ktedonobacteraceae bacterium]